MPCIVRLRKKIVEIFPLHVGRCTRCHRVKERRRASTLSQPGFELFKHVAGGGFLVVER